MPIFRYQEFLESNKTHDMWNYIPESVKELHQIFKAAGKKLLVVGGSVRDFLNHEQPKDFDLATDALPEEIVKIIGKKWRVTLQGKSFFVVMVYTEDQPDGMEIATFRTDSYRNSDIDNFILYIQEKKPEDYEERIRLLLNLSKD